MLGITLTRQTRINVCILLGFCGFACSGFVFVWFWFLFVFLSSTVLFYFSPSTFSMAKLHDERHTYKPTNVTKKVPD